MINGFDLAIDARGVRKSYGRGADVLRGADMHVARGEAAGLVGRNGAGKTTLLMCFAGLLQCEASLLLISGSAGGSLEARQAVGFVPERLVGYGHFTAHDFLRYLGSLSGLSTASLRLRADELLARFEIRGGMKLQTMSRGMRQRLAICQALIHRPRVLLLDEPTSALDSEGIELFKTLLREALRDGAAAVLSSHRLEDVRELCCRTFLLENGQLTEERDRVTVTSPGHRRTPAQ